jgi:hypothetical protein
MTASHPDSLTLQTWQVLAEFSCSEHQPNVIEMALGTAAELGLTASDLEQLRKDLGQALHLPEGPVGGSKNDLPVCLRILVTARSAAANFSPPGLQNRATSRRVGRGGRPVPAGWGSFLVERMVAGKPNQDEDAVPDGRTMNTRQALASDESPSRSYRVVDLYLYQEGT